MSLDGIKPHVNKHTYTWIVKSPKQVKVIYRAEQNIKDIILNYSQGPIKMVWHVKGTNKQKPYLIKFADGTYKSPSMSIRDDGTIEIDWSNTNKKSTPSNLLIKPNGIVEIDWQDRISQYYGNDPNIVIKTKHDKQGNLLYMIKRLSSEHFYILELLSLDTYNVQHYLMKNNTTKWASLMMNSKVIHI